jgi:site-specific DNA-cytosine methylase
MHNNNTIVPYISLCSGYEGIGLGLHRCIPNLRCIAYCEREAFAISNLVEKMEKGLLDEAPVFTDVTTFPWEQFAPYMAGGILSFGWPCQPVSMAGKRKATEDERWLFDIIADGISIMRPGMLFAENVEGLLSAKMPDGSSVFGHCIERLERLHYKVEAGIFSASEVGAPHQRKRVFILAYREEQGLEGLRGLESDFIWNDAWQDGTARGEELAYSCDGANTEAGYAEAHRLSSEHRTEVCSGFIGGTDATPWPSRPGEQQYAWEPPRVVANAERGRGEEPKLQHTNLPSEPSGRDSESVGDSSSKRPYRGSEDGANQQPEVLGTGHEAMGNSNSLNRSASPERWQHDPEIGSTSEWKAEPSLGRDADGSSGGVDISELSGLSHQELAEICEWMVRCDNRTDELRLLGNGCVPATVSRAFLTLLNKLNNE